MEAAAAADRATRPRALEGETMCEVFQATVAEHPDMVALRTPGGGTEIT